MMVSDLPALVQPFANPTNIDLQSRRFLNSSDGIAATDLVTVQQLRKAIAAVTPEEESTVDGLLASTDGVRVGAFASRGSAIAHRGEFFVASDRNYVAWLSTGGAWQYMFGIQTGTLSPDTKPTADMTTADVGYQFFSSDFGRIYAWNGTGWVDYPGHTRRGSIQYFPVTLHADFAPGTGWALCDGTAGVTRSTPTGGTTTVTLPNLTTANRFLRSVATTTGGTGGSATTHTHQVDPPNTSSSGPVSGVTDADNGAGQEVQSGTGVTVAAHTHDHNMAGHIHAVDIAAFASAAPSGSGGDDALPPYYNARPYMRL